MSGSLLYTPMPSCQPTVDIQGDKAAFLLAAYAAAKAAGHIWPIFAACEAALDSDFGTLEPAVNANNVFNLRAPARVPSQMAYAIWTMTVNGRQYDWLKFPDLPHCFACRMGKLRKFPIYYQAVRAKTGQAYIAEISKVWSQDPARAQKVLALVNALAPSLPEVNLKEAKL